MATESFPFDNQLVSEAQFSRMFTRIQDTGVVPNGLAVSADSSGMTVHIAPGEAFVRGHFFGSTATETLPIATSAPQARIDLVVLRLDPADDSIVLAVRTGTPAATPTVPVPVQTETGIFELPLAQVAVTGNAVTIPGSAVADVRTWTGKTVRPWTTATRPTNTYIGTLGFNTTTGLMEFWNGSAWRQLPRLDSGFASGSVRIENRPPVAADGANGDIWLEW